MEKDRPRYATVRDYVRVLRQQRVLIALVALVFAAAAFLISSQQAKRYSAEAAMEFSEPTQAYDLIGQPIGSRQAPDQLAAAGAELVKRQPVASAVGRALKLKVPSRQLLGLVDAQPESRTNFVIVRAHSSSPVLAARIANQFARQAERITDNAARARFQRAADTIKQQLKDLKPSPQNALSRSLARERLVRLQSVIDVVDAARIVRRADVPTSASSPSPVRDGIVGLLVGLTLGIIAAFIRDALDPRVRGSGAMGFEPLPLLGHISNEVMGRARFLANGRRPVAPVFLEHFQILRRNIEFLDPQAPPRSVVVTSPLAEEGKSTVAASVAWASVVSGRSTLLVECDLRRPSLAQKLEIETTPGLADYLLGDVGPNDVLQTVEVQAAPLGGNSNKAISDSRRSLVCITAGRLRASSPPELFDSARFRQFLEQVTQVYDLVVLDCAPLLPVADTLELIPQADAVLLCLRARHTTVEQVRSAKTALERFPARPTGIVLTDVRPGDAKSFGYYSSYDYAGAQHG